MAFLADTARVEIIQTYLGSPWAMQVFHMWNLGTGAPVTQTLANDIAAAVEAELGPGGITNSFDDNVTFSEVRVKDNSGPGNEYVSSEVDITGTSATELLPRAVSLVVSHRSLSGLHHGRNYMWGFSEGNSTNGRPTTTVVDFMVGFWNGLRTGIVAETSGDWTPTNIRSAGSPVVVTQSPWIESFRTASATAQGWQNQRRRADGLQLL